MALREGYVMSPGARMEYLDSIYIRYKRASRKQKSKILNEFCINTCYHRKHALRLHNKYKRFTKPKLKKRGRLSRYNKESIIVPLKRIWLTANLPCSKLLRAIIPLQLPHYAKEYGGLPLHVVTALLKISPASIDRILKPVRIKYRGRGRSTTKPGTLLRKQIPIKTNQWDESKLGFLEADTVAHCGDTVEGVYANTVNFVDIATGWTEQRAVWGKGELGVLNQIKDVEINLPFPLLGFDSDNGGEFLNWHLFRHFTNNDRKQVTGFTRSRAYHKNDNAHIEQKNWTHIRQWIGYDRLDNPDAIPLMNELYESEQRFYHNFFCPSVKLIQKKRVASKTIKHYDKPKTPYQRILESKNVSRSMKLKIKEQFKGLNPFTLRKNMEKKLKKVFLTTK